jgi:hypothetical protein
MCYYRLALICLAFSPVLSLSSSHTPSGSQEEFLRKFKNAVSKGFDPDVHLNKVCKRLCGVYRSIHLGSILRENKAI